MARVMAVSFERYGRLYYLDPGDSMYAVGDKVLVPTDSGPEVAECVWAPEWVDDDPGYADLPLCAGKADQADLDRDEVGGQKVDQEERPANESGRGGLPRLRC